MMKLTDYARRLMAAPFINEKAAKLRIKVKRINRDGVVLSVDVCDSTGNAIMSGESPAMTAGETLTVDGISRAFEINFT